MSTVFFIRHGQASFGKANYDALSDLGREQIRALAKHLHGMGVDFNSVYSGTLCRQTESANIFGAVYAAEGHRWPAATELDAFDEYDSENVLKAFVPIMMTEDASFERQVRDMFTDKRAFQQVFEKVMHRFVAETDDMPQVEKWSQFTRRVNSGIDRIMAADGRGKNVAVFTSGGPIAVGVQKTLHLSDMDTMRLNWQIVNASVTRFKCTQDRIMLSSFNIYDYLAGIPGGGWVTYR